MTLGSFGSMGPAGCASALPPRTSDVRPYCQGGSELGSLAGAKDLENGGKWWKMVEKGDALRKLFDLTFFR
jgi:hypothetical protein